MRTVVRSTLIAGMTGALMVSAAWAGIGISPVPVPSAPEVSTPLQQAPGTASKTTSGSVVTSANAAALGAGTLLVGAAKNSMAPQPEAMRKKGFPNAVWETDPSRCKKLAPETIQRALTETQVELDHLAAAGSPWPENPNCIYQGGFSLGPQNPVKAFDTEYGL